MLIEGASAYQLDDTCRLPTALLAPPGRSGDALADGLADAVVAALPCRIAALDCIGTIVGVNDLWRRQLAQARDSGIPGRSGATRRGALEEKSIGLHYRQGWLNYEGAPSSLTQEIADNIQAVL